MTAYDEAAATADELEAESARLHTLAVGRAAYEMAGFARDLVADGCPECDGKISIAGNTVWCPPSCFDNRTGCGWKHNASELHRRALASAVLNLWRDER